MKPFQRQIRTPVMTPDEQHIGSGPTNLPYTKESAALATVWLATSSKGCLPLGRSI